MDSLPTIIPVGMGTDVCSRRLAPAVSPLAVVSQAALSMSSSSSTNQKTPTSGGACWRIRPLMSCALLRQLLCRIPAYTLSILSHSVLAAVCLQNPFLCWILGLVRTLLSIFSVVSEVYSSLS